MWSALLTLVSRLHLVASRRRIDDETVAELDAHLELLAERNRGAGMSPGEAERAARRQMGNTLLVREDIYRTNSIGSLERAAHDLRSAGRLLRRQPALAITAIATLALGIGATTAVFAIVYGIVIQPLPYPKPDSLVAVWTSAEFQGVRFPAVNLSSTMYLSFREHNQTFEEFGLWRSATATVTGGGDPEEVRSVIVTAGTLPALGVHPMLGRWFSRSDDTPDTPETAILGHGYWQRRFGGDPTIVGRTVIIDHRPREIIGVMPQRFRVVTLEPEVILPQRFTDGQLQPNDVHAYTGLARVKPGVSLVQANEDVARMLPLWIIERGTNREALEAAGFAAALRPIKEDVVGDAAPALWVLMGAIGVVLLIACANVANLLLVRADGRQHELAVRAALGAGRRQIARQLLVESLTLAMLGGAMGLAVALGGLRLLVAIGPANLPRLADVAIDPVVVAFAFLVSLGCGLAFGLVPVLKYVRPRLAIHLESASRLAGQSLERHRTQRALVVVQVALAVVLLVASGLMLRTAQALRNVHPGFEAPQHVQTVRVSIPESLVPDPDRVVHMQHDLVQAMRAIPGVTSVTFATALPMEPEFQNSSAVTAEGLPDTTGIPAMRRDKFVAPGYFETLGIPLRAGRDVTWTDVYESRDVTMVSESLARELWGNPDAAVGRRIRIGRVGPWREIVGVAGDVHEDGVHAAAPAIVYWRAGVGLGPINPSFIARSMTFAVRSNRTNSDGLVADLRDAVGAVNASLPLARVQSLEALYTQTMARTSFVLVMLAIAGSMALLLGVVGIYGVLAYVVSQRRREIGVRMAFGAPHAQVRRRFVRYGLTLAAIGVVIGSAVALGVTRLLDTLLFGVPRWDPVTYVVVPIVLMLAAAVASYLPARRASLANPVDALRVE